MIRSHTDTIYTHELSVGLGLDLVFSLFGISILRFSFFSSDDFVLVFAFLVLGLVSSVLRQEIGWEERL